MNEEKNRRTSGERLLNVSEILLIRYAIVFLIAFLIGLIGYYAVHIPLSDGLNTYITSHFSRTFNFGSGISQNATALTVASYSDMKTLVLIFVAGFTMFSSIAIYWLLSAQAVSLGFSSLYLVNAMSSGKLTQVHFFDLVIFLLSSAALSALMIVFSSKTRIFNDVFRGLGNRKKLIIRSKPLYKQIFTLITLCGAVIFINTLRFLLNYL